LRATINPRSAARGVSRGFRRGTFGCLFTGFIILKSRRCLFESLSLGFWHEQGAISRFAGAIQQEQAETETKWEAADRMEAARLREDKNRMVGGK
jgi:hypothetical protein